MLDLHENPGHNKATHLLGLRLVRGTDVLTAYMELVLPESSVNSELPGLSYQSCELNST